MSRSGYGYGEDDSNVSYLWHSIVQRAARVKRGQAFFRALIAALDALPEKKLLAEVIVSSKGVCAIGAMIRDNPKAAEIDPEDYDHHEELANLVNIAESLVREVEYYNDEYGPKGETPEARWVRMRGWAERQLLKPDPLTQALTSETIGP